MAISFIRCDDRIIHGQIIIRWSTEFPCDGIIAVNDKAATNPVIKNALKAASTKKTFIWSREQFAKKMDEAINSQKNYFVITKEPITMAELLVDKNMKTLTNVLNIGPQSARPGTVNVNKNADITDEEIDAYERIHQNGYDIQFRLVPDASVVHWKEVREELLGKREK